MAILDHHHHHHPMRWGRLQWDCYCYCSSCHCHSHGCSFIALRSRLSAHRVFDPRVEENVSRLVVASCRCYYFIMVAGPGTATGRAAPPTSVTMDCSPRIAVSTPPTMSKRANLGRDVAGSLASGNGTPGLTGGQAPLRLDQGPTTVAVSPTGRSQDRTRQKNNRQGIQKE